MNIEQQKKIADECLDKLMLIDPYCILAGGAPRDWYDNKEANDLDFYIYSENPTGIIESQLNSAGFEGLKVLNSTRGKEFEVRSEMYSSMKSLRKVFETTYKDMKIQIMVMGQKTFSCVVPNFGATISMFWYKGGTIRYNFEAIASFKYKVIGYRDDFTCKETYYKKLKDRYKSYSFVRMSSFDKVINNSMKRDLWEEVISSC